MTNTNCWARLGVNITLTKAEKVALENDPAKHPDIIRKAFEEGRVALCGDSYIPDGIVVDDEGRTADLDLVLNALDDTPLLLKKGDGQDGRH